MDRAVTSTMYQHNQHPLRLLLSLLLVSVAAGCPAPSRYIVADVSARRAPVEDAVVAADCGDPEGHSALRTDERGRARVALAPGRHSERCVVTVAKPGYTTVERRGASACTKPSACPPTTYELEPVAGGADR